MNSVSLVGRVISEPELKFLEKAQTQVASCRISVNRGNGKKDAQGYPESDVFSIEVWGKSAEALANHIKKGDGISVVGRVELKKVEDGKGYWVTIKDCRWSFLPKASGSDGGGSTSSSAPADDIDF